MFKNLQICPLGGETPKFRPSAVAKRFYGAIAYPNKQLTLSLVCDSAINQSGLVSSFFS